MIVCAPCRGAETAEGSLRGSATVGSVSSDAKFDETAVIVTTATVEFVVTKASPEVTRGDPILAGSSGRTVASARGLASAGSKAGAERGKTKRNGGGQTYG